MSEFQFRFKIKVTLSGRFINRTIKEVRVLAKAPFSDGPKDKVKSVFALSRKCVPAISELVFAMPLARASTDFGLE